MKPIVNLVFLVMASVAMPAIADDYCDELNRPVGCIARPGVTPGVGVGAPGVGVVDPGINQPGAIGNKGPANRGGPVNRAGRL